MDMSISAGNIVTIITVLVSIGIAWGVVRTQVASHTIRIETLEKLQEDSSRCQTQLDVRLARIEVDVQWIRASLSGRRAE